MQVAKIDGIGADSIRIAYDEPIDSSQVDGGCSLHRRQPLQRFFQGATFAIGRRRINVLPLPTPSLCAATLP
ncbi:MAG: hypothetical protein K2X55_27485 [Burkholderiaceae bacterium]|nr:hypothetical protein [Burkholderiaceae bacterium]